MRYFLFLASIMFAAPAYWIQKSIGTNPVAPFTLSRVDTTIDGQIHDTADTLRKYTRGRIADSLATLRAASTLQAAYNASTAPQITTSAAKGALTLRRGSASDPDAVLSVQDGSGVQTAYIAGNGAVAGAQVNVSSATANTLARFDAAKYLTSYALVAGDIPALPAYVRRIGDTITGPIVGTTATATPLVNIATTFGNLTNAAIRGTASASGGAAIHGVATGTNGVGIWGVSLNTGGDGGLFSGTGGAHAVRAIATGGGKAGLFQGDVQISGTTTLASSLTGILKASSGAVSVADTSDFPTRPYLPLAAGAGSPLTGVLYGTGLNFTTTADAPISISHSLAGGFTHPFQAFNSGMVAGNQYNFDFGQSASTNNAGNFGFKYVGAGSSSNYVTLGMYGANDLMTITAAGVPKFSGLATAGFVRANASGQLSSSALVAADIPALDASKITTGTLPDARIASASFWDAKVSGFGSAGSIPKWTTSTNLGIATASDFPILNQSTTGNAATATKWATARTLTIGATGKTIDGTGNQSWSLAEIGAQAAGSYLPVNNPTFTGVLNGPVVDITGAGSGTVGAGPYVGTRNGSSAGWLLQLGASNTWDLWNLAASTWTKQGAFSPGGNLSLNGAVTAGNAAMATWAPAAGYAWFGANNQNQSTSGNSGFLQQNSSGRIYMCAPSGTQAEIQVNGATILSATSSGVTLAGTTTLSALTGATTRVATINATGQIGAGEVASTTPQAFGSNINLSSVTSRTLYPTASGLSITIPTSGVTLGQTFKLSTNAYSVTILCPGVTVYYAGTTFTSGSSITNSVMVDIVCLSATVWAIGIN